MQRRHHTPPVPSSSTIPPRAGWPAIALVSVGLVGPGGLVAGCRGAAGGCTGPAPGARTSSASGAAPTESPADDGDPTGPADVSGGRPLLDLLAQRPLAVVFEDGALTIDAAPAELHKFIAGTTGGWTGLKASIIPGERDRQDGEDRRIAVIDGQTAQLRLPGTGLVAAGPNSATAAIAATEPGGAQPLSLSIWLRPAADVPRQAMSVFLNDRLLGNLELAPGLRPYRVAIPDGRLLPGDNALRLFFRGVGTIGAHRSAAALWRVRLGPGNPPPGPGDAAAGLPGVPVLPGRVRSFGIGGDARPALVASRPTRWSYFLVPPPGAQRLAFGYGVQTGGAPALVSVSARWQGQADATPLFSGRGEPGRWQEAVVPLTPPNATAGAVRLDLSIASETAQRPSPSLAGAGAGNLGAIAQPRLLGTAAPRPPATARAEHLVVFVVDALRADRVLPRPGARPLPLPGVARLLEGGAALRATTPATYPLPAHATLLTGTYPAIHRLLREDAAPPDNVPLLAEALHRAGFATGLFSGDGYVSDRWGLRRGFDAYRNLVREGLPSGSAEVWKAARGFLEDQVRAGRRAFLYVAVADPHLPYNPPAEALARVHPHPYGGPLRPERTLEQVALVKRGRLKLGHEDRAYLEALYDAEVLQMDATLLKVQEDLTRLGIADKTAVAFVGSHGEELLDHGSIGHGHALYDELTTVPLLLRFPPRVAVGERPATELRAELCDLMPTVLALTGVGVPEGVQGESLLPFIAQPSSPTGAIAPRAGIAEHEQHLRSLHLGRYHLILGGERPLLFDLLADPNERQPLDPQTTGVVALQALRGPLALFHAFQARWHKPRLGQPAALRPGFQEDLGP